MDQKIRELAEKAGWHDDRNFATGNKIYQWQNFDKEKFAELIIQECIDSCNINQVHGTLMAERRIKEHFGIEQ